MVADGSILNITEACAVEAEVLGLKLEGLCGVMDLFMDALLGVDFFNATKFVLLFGKQTLKNSETGTEVLFSLSLPNFFAWKFHQIFRRKPVFHLKPFQLMKPVQDVKTKSQYQNLCDLMIIENIFKLDVVQRSGRFAWTNRYKAAAFRHTSWPATVRRAKKRINVLPKKL